MEIFLSKLCILLWKFEIEIIQSCNSKSNFKDYEIRARIVKYSHATLYCPVGLAAASRISELDLRVLSAQSDRTHSWWRHFFVMKKNLQIKIFAKLQICKSLFFACVRQAERCHLIPIKPNLSFAISKRPSWMTWGPLVWPQIWPKISENEGCVTLN